MPNTKIIHVPHLGGIDASYQLAQPYDGSKPTLVLINSFTTSSELYRSQLANRELTDVMNIIAIELLGHGQTRTKAENWTYWDTAIMNLQVLDGLGMAGNGKKVFVLGTSQGGWVTVRMALLAPEQITGIIPLGTSMDSESPRSRELGCWNGAEGLQPNIKAWSTNDPTPDFKPSRGFTDFLLETGFGKECPAETRDFWTNEVQKNYAGDEGRRRLRMCGINLAERDGLHGRLWDVRCPVLWLHGTGDVVYSIRNAEEEVKMFVNSPEARLEVVEGGQHFLSFSHPKEVDGKVLEFVRKYGL